MNKINIFFDLDGTLTDSAEGIINCAVTALEYFGIDIPSTKEMEVFIGPPLRETFVKFGVPEEMAEKAVEIYRKRYIPIGMYENKLYSGIKELLENLKKSGFGLFIATSKPEKMAVEILKYLDIYKFFDIVCGASLDTSRDSKSDVIKYLLNQTDRNIKTVMVGDTVFDVMGAEAHGIPTVGVLWGYGDAEDMLKKGALKIAATPEELQNILTVYAEN